MDYKTYEVRVYADGDKYWFIDDKLHREDGPAVHASGGKFWYLNGKLHREDGPAIEFINGDKHWYVDGKSLTEQQFNNRNKHSCNGKIVDIEGKKYKLVEQ